MYQLADFNQPGVCNGRQQPMPNPLNCGCPMQEEDSCWQCWQSCPLETHIFQQPRRVEKPHCYFTIPAIPCVETKEERRLPCDPLCFDWTVDEPGPNDSYGLNGLNPSDWLMEDINRYAMQFPTRGYTPNHPGYSKVQAPSNTPVYMCKLPLECYSRFPGPCKPSPFAKNVNYFRDFRCCKTKPPPQWRRA
ncbi:hypothetical protein ElyMa_006618700 [Elysia marginata]|uniref:4Fe-4S ferredoxin-type domain-containing protein n=1 Tax=Elysia marginata TaxID=1093978 RepID=A0AAV4IE82_9GAST|nr:hypothetical protein ElyMa_006618700 [Elysia marginata]